MWRSKSNLKNNNYKINNFFYNKKHYIFKLMLADKENHSFFKKLRYMHINIKQKYKINDDYFELIIIRKKKADNDEYYFLLVFLVANKIINGV